MRIILPFLAFLCLAHEASAQNLITGASNAQAGTASGTTWTATGSSMGIYSNSFTIVAGQTFTLSYTLTGTAPNGGFAFRSQNSSGGSSVIVQGGSGVGLATGTYTISASSISSLIGTAYLRAYDGGGASSGFVISNLSLTAMSSGPDATNTTSALTANQSTLRGVMERRLTGLALVAQIDCQVFDRHGVCLSFQTRYSNFETFHEGAGVLNVAYRLSENLRIGTLIDYRASEKKPTGIKFSDDLPTFGAFVGYGQNPNGTALQGKVLAAVQNGTATITRDSSLSSTEPGSGKGSLNSYLLSGELGWGFAVSPSLLATPYIGIRYTDLTRGGYAEGTVSGTVDHPITYNDYHQRLTTATAGVRVAGMLTDNIGYQVGAAVETDLRTQTSSYSGTSDITGLTSFALDTSGVNNRTRGFGSVSMFYQIDKNQRLTGNVSFRNQAYTSQNAVSAMAGYQVAF